MRRCPPHVPRQAYFVSMVRGTAEIVLGAQGLAGPMGLESCKVVFYFNLHRHRIVTQGTLAITHLPGKGLAPWKYSLTRKSGYWWSDPIGTLNILRHALASPAKRSGSYSDNTARLVGMKSVHAGAARSTRGATGNEQVAPCPLVGSDNPPYRSQPRKGQ